MMNDEFSVEFGSRFQILHLLLRGATLRTETQGY